MGLPAISPSPNTSKRAHQHAIYPYLLRDLTITQPTHVWGVDITCIRLRSGWVYLYAVLDWYSRFVVSWTLDVTLDMGFVLAAIRTVLSLATSTICNTDQGSHFTSPFYTDLLRDAHVPISIDGKARARQPLYQTPLAYCQVRRDLPEGLCLAQ